MRNRNGTGDDARLFVVDDERRVADMLAGWLKPHYDVEVAYSGDTAIERIDDHVDVVLLDRRMPGTSGDEVLEWIVEEGIDCYVVMVTAVNPDVSIIEMGFHDYLVKPVNKDTLIDAVNRMLTRKRQEERILELFQLASKLTTLETKLDMVQLQHSTAYGELQADLEAVWEDLEAHLDSDDFALEATIEKLQSVLAMLGSKSTTEPIKPK